MTEYLKIKDGVDLKELEKFGFKKEHIDFERYFYPVNDFTGIIIEHETRIIKLYDHIDPVIYRNVLAKIYDLITAGLVEKVVENG